MKNCKACVCKRRRAPEASRQLKFLSRSCRTCAWHPRTGERCGASWWLTWRSLWARTSKIAGNSATSISTELPCNDLNLDWNFELNKLIEELTQSRRIPDRWRFRRWCLWAWQHFSRRDISWSDFRPSWIRRKSGALTDISSPSCSPSLHNRRCDLKSEEEKNSTFIFNHPLRDSNPRPLG